MKEIQKIDTKRRSFILSMAGMICFWTFLFKNEKIEAKQNAIAYIDYNRCSNCRHCIRACSIGAIFYDGQKIVIDKNKCVGCKACINRCKAGAIVVE